MIGRMDTVAEPQTPNPKPQTITPTLPAPIKSPVNKSPVKLLYVSEMAEPDMHDLTVYAGLAEGVEDSAWFATRIHELKLAESVAVQSVQVCLGDALPSTDDFDGVVIGGSYHMVSEDRPWQRAILAWLAHAWRAPRPLLGICGGHQLMAHFFGAAVEPISSGTWSETTPIALTAEGRAHWLFAGMPPQTPYHFACSEHVARPPTTATVLAQQNGSPAVALDYGRSWVSVQFHPEMSAEAMQQSWQRSAPERARRYAPSPQSAQIIANFVRHIERGKYRDV